jgi:hypothetical protein
MKFKNQLLTVATISLLSFFSACKKKDPIVQTPATIIERVVKYEITGNYSGNFTISFTSANGSFETTEALALPWTKSFTASEGTTVMSASAAGNSGSVGQTAILKIFVNGAEVKAGSGTALSSGYISLNPGSYIFP